VKLLLAEVHALRLGLMNNTNFSLVKFVSTLVPRRKRYFAVTYSRLLIVRMLVTEVLRTKICKNMCFFIRVLSEYIRVDK